MKHFMSQYVKALKKCIEACDKTYESNQVLSEVCSINLNKKCAAQLGKTVKLSDSCIKSCEAVIKECTFHIRTCENKKCVQKCNACIKACKAAIATCQKSIKECDAHTVKCISLSFAGMKKLIACGQACQACLDHGHSLANK